MAGGEGGWRAGCWGAGSVDHVAPLWWWN